MHRAMMAYQVCPVTGEMWEDLVHKVSPDQRETLDHKVSVVTLDLSDLPEIQDPQDHQEVPVPSDLEVPLDPLDPMDHLGRKDLMVCKDHLGLQLVMYS